MHIHYDESYQVEAIEFGGTAVPKFQNFNLLGLSYDQLLKIFAGFDDDVEEDDSGFTSYKLGIGVYAPFKDDEPNLNCEGVIVFKRDYYTTG